MAKKTAKTEKLNSKSVSGQKSQRGKNGGARKGAGRKKGQLSPATIEKNVVLAAFRERIFKRVDDLYNSQMRKALGEFVLICLDVETGLASKVTDEETIIKYFNGELKEDGKKTKKYYSIQQTAPDTKVADSLLDRAFGKAVQAIEGNLDVNFNKIIGELDDQFDPDELEED